MKDSQYLNDYLDTNSRLGYDKGYTIGTYLTYQLRGNARSWSGRYAGALLRSLERLVQKGLVRVGRSSHGSIAYYRIAEVK